MSIDPANFVFDGCGFDAGTDFVARLPAGISTRSELFFFLRTELHLPDYFGENWDALSECLRDLSWIKGRRVVIVHAELPSLDRATLTTYFGVLAECVQDWKPGEEHELIVVFPKSAREAILRKEELKGGIKGDAT